MTLGVKFKSSFTKEKNLLHIRPLGVRTLSFRKNYIVIHYKCTWKNLTIISIAWKFLINNCSLILITEKTILFMIFLIMDTNWKLRRENCRRDFHKRDFKKQFARYVLPKGGLSNFNTLEGSCLIFKNSLLQSLQMCSLQPPFSSRTASEVFFQNF